MSYARVVIAFYVACVMTSKLTHAAYTFGIGDRVKCIAPTLNVRTSAAGPLSGSPHSLSETGTIVGGPEFATLAGTSYVWYEIDWDSGTDGWSADKTGDDTPGFGNFAFTIDRIALVAYNAGFRSVNLVKAIAIAKAESEWAPNAVGTITSADTGLWQVNLDAHSSYTRQQLLDPDANAAAAFSIATNGTNWSPWATYFTPGYAWEVDHRGNGPFKNFLDTSRTAARALDTTVIQLVGDRVKINVTSLSVRSTAGGASLNQDRNPSSLGTVQAGPISAQIGGAGEWYIWWQIDWDDGVVGWSAEEFMQRDGSSPSTRTITLGASPVSGGTTDGGGSYPVGTIHAVTAIANAGYTFVNWSENGTSTSTSPSYPFSVTSDRILTANFALNPSSSVPEPAGYSATFVVDTRDQTALLDSVSNVFSIDTRSTEDLLHHGSASDSFTLDTRVTHGIGEIVISGPSIVTSGSETQYKCFLNAGDGSLVDISNLCTMRILGGTLPYIGIGGLTLFVSGDAAPMSFQIAAMYRNTTGQSSATRTITVQRALTATASALSVHRSGITYDISLTGSVNGGTPPYLFRWDTNGDGIYGDAVGSSTAYSVARQSETLNVGLEVSDAFHRIAKASARMSLEKPPVENEPKQFKPSLYLGTSELKGPDGGDGNFDAAKATKGLILMTHGMRDDWDRPDEDGHLWLPHMAQRIRSRIPMGDQPNILIYGWGADSDAASYPAEQVARAKDQLGVLGFLAPLTGVTSDLLIDSWYARNHYASIHGQRLANLILEAEKVGLAHRDKPVHFIGHSAGGFVIGDCALLLKQRGYPVSMVTMLDTPFPKSDHISPPRCATRVERYISSFYGALDVPSVSDLPKGDDYSKENISFWSGAKFSFAAHGRSHDWYTDETVEKIDSSTGFRYSPFCPSSLYPFSSTGQALENEIALSSNESAQAIGTTEVSLTSFQSFGQTSANSGIHTLTEISHAGIFALVDFPFGTVAVKFRCRFAAPGDGDELTVYAGDQPIYTVLDLPLTRDGFLEFEAPAYELDGQTEVLTFKLVSRGAANAIVQVENVRLIVDDDPDSDGLTTAQEQTAGTDPLLADTDGDTISDAEEINGLPSSNPLAKDSDQDGLSDFQERVAGTNPINAESRFQMVQSTISQSGGFKLEWAGRTGKTYRVQRSSVPRGTTYTTVATGITGQEPLTSFTDNTLTVPASENMFYWVEVEE